MTRHLTHNGLPEGMTRWQFFRLIESARRQLGLSKGAIAYLKVAISSTMDDDFLPGRICSFWKSVTKIATLAAMDRRQVARIDAPQRSIYFSQVFFGVVFLVGHVGSKSGSLVSDLRCFNRAHKPGLNLRLNCPNI